MTYAERIRGLREDRDRTQQEIADMLKVGQRTYCDYELGKTRIPVDSLIVLAKYYNVDMNYICGISDKKKIFPKE
jgi:transcriptional regulator with XRE-family HTH domain